MKACIINEFGGRDKLTFTDLPQPEPGEGQVLIRVAAAGVNPVDWKIREGLLKDLFPHRFPLILGWDVAGVVEAAGFSARRFEPDAQVYAYARRPEVHQGTYAQYIALPESYVALKPANIDLVTAAAIPLVALTAHQSLFDAGQLARDETVLILGASGGVGSCAVQFARLSGARIIALASGANRTYLKELGAHEVLDYRAADWPQKIQRLAPGGADLVYDCVGGASLTQAAACVKPGGRLISITTPEPDPSLASRGIQYQFVFVEPNAPQLERFAELTEAGRFKLHVNQVYPFAKVKEAHARMETGHTRGKLVLKVS